MLVAVNSARGDLSPCFYLVWSALSRLLFPTLGPIIALSIRRVDYNSCRLYTLLLESLQMTRSFLGFLNDSRHFPLVGGIENAYREIRLPTPRSIRVHSKQTSTAVYTRCQRRATRAFCACAGTRARKRANIPDDSRAPPRTAFKPSFE